MSRTIGLLQVLTLRCEDASVLASRELDESLGGLERVALWGHLLVCRSCGRFRGQIRLIRAAIRLRERRHPDPPPDDDALSPEARRRIARAIAEATAGDARDTDTRDD
jgi:hypothetical protein